MCGEQHTATVRQGAHGLMPLGAAAIAAM